MKLSIAGYTESQLNTLVLADLQRQRAEIDERITSIKSQLGINGTAAHKPQPAAKASPAPKAKGKHVLSPEARANIIAAQKKRWAKVHREQKAAKKVIPKKRGHRINLVPDEAA